jgi:hypothetical protein
MSWSIRHCVSRGLSLCLSLALLMALGPLPAMADEAAESLNSTLAAEDMAAEDIAAEEATGRFAREVIIDDSGIVIIDGEDEYILDEDGFAGDDFDFDSRYTMDLDDEQNVIFGRDVVIDEDEVIHNDMIIINGDLDVYGRVIGDIVIIVGDISLYDGSEVTGDLLCIGGEVIVEPGAEAFGEITALGDDLSSVFFNDEWGSPPFKSILPLWHLNPSWTGQNLLVLLILTLVSYLLLVRRIPNITSTVRFHPWRSLLVGFLSLIVGTLLLVPAILLIILLAFTVVGIPISILSVLAIIGFAHLAVFVPIFTFSYYSFEMRGMNRYFSMAIWVAIFWLLSMIGKLTGVFFVVQFLFFLVGLGALVITRLGARETSAG